MISPSNAQLQAMVTTLSMFSLFVLVGFAVFMPVDGHGRHTKRNLPALNTQVTNNIANGADGPQLYYNGSGNVPGYNLTTPPPSPITPFTSNLEDYFYAEIAAFASNKTAINDTCGVCISITEVMHFAAITQPVDSFVRLLIRYCDLGTVEHFAPTCHAEFATTPLNASTYSSDAGGLGPYWAQLYAKMSQATGDMQAWCHYQFDSCSAPPVIEIDESLYFSPKPESANTAPAPGSETLDVLHLSDWHLDPRYDIGSEANCTDYLCCRPYAVNEDLGTSGQDPSVPASRYGALYCDSPPDLAISSFTSMDKFFNKSGVAFTIFTGDIVSHDNSDQLSLEYTIYEEKVTYDTFKAHMGSSPVYVTLGNHDSFPEAYNTPNDIADGTGNTASNAMSYNYKFVSSLWARDGWIAPDAADYAAKHYGAYAHTTKEGLRIISINTDFWYTANIFNYYNFSNPDPSGILSFLASELEACESRGQRAWIIGHVISGYDGTNPLPNPSALFYSIIRRFSPATIAAVFFGHTHEDQLMIYYDYAASSTNPGSTLRNTQDIDYSGPLQMGFIGPSITPLTGYNAGYQLLQVDSKTFSVMGIQTYFANMSDSLTWTTPEWQFEYDARRTYDVGDIDWPETAPLNATFYDKVTQVMLRNQSLVETYNLYETKSSVMTEDCKSAACAKQKVCYIRSGSAALGLACGDEDGPS